MYDININNDENYLNNFICILKNNELDLKNLCGYKNFFYKNDGLLYFDIKSSTFNDKLLISGKNDKNLYKLNFKDDIIFTMDCNLNDKLNILLINLNNIDKFTEKYIIYENNIYKFNKKKLNHDFGGIYYMKLPINSLDILKNSYNWYINIEKDCGFLWNYELIN